MWEEYGENETEGYLGNEGASSNTTYSRYAIVAWPVANGVENTLQFINATAAIEVLQHQKSVAPDTLRVFVNAVGDKLVETQASFDRSRTYSYTEPKKVSVSALFSQTISKLLVDTGDVWLATLFFTKICSNVKEKANLVPAYVALARKFDWSSIGQALLSSLGSKTGNSRYSFDAFGGTSDSSMVLALQIFDGLDDGLAKEALLKAAVSDAVTLRNDCLCASKALGSLWVSTIRNGNKSVVDVLAKRLKQMDPSLLGPVIDVFLQELSDVNSSDDMFAVLASIATMRIEWLKSQIQAKDKPFSWEMPHAIFPDPQIQVFLRGPEMSKTTVGVRTFGGLPAARKFAERTPQTHASFSMVPAGRGQEAFATITKTRTWFSKQQNDVVTHKSELQCLIDRFGQATAEEGPALKRARIEVWEHRG
ncbi:hypothetical protein L914_17209 [Phytophthora nicotianae]|uniref:Uncharacterized protein n=1 Tax=Phytophthora nicotianae TaxID=4792 RepID=W2MKI4_PHYNI|nr:hypothetical protein L914_17209 [Phytophthora nicotianae]